MNKCNINNNYSSVLDYNPSVLYGIPNTKILDKRDDNLSFPIFLLFLTVMFLSYIHRLYFLSDSFAIAVSVVT